MKKIFKIFFTALLAVCMAAGFAGCASSYQNSPQIDVPNSGHEDEKILVAYFSATGNTEKIADYIAQACSGEKYEIVPLEPYSDEDLDYNSDCRANREQNDESARPAISGDKKDMSGYFTVFVGYPIWWGKLPKIMYTFFDLYDFSGKTIIPFCTSGSSGITTSVAEIKALEPEASVLEGWRFSSGTDSKVVAEWAKKTLP